jgi:hypothetical protein
MPFAHYTSPVRGNCRTSPYLAWLPLVLLLSVTALAYAPSLNNPFFGSDTWPWLASSRVPTFAEGVALAFMPIMPGTQFLAEVALFYHPLTSLTYAVDLALFGLQPTAMYATNLLVHLVAVGALYSLARGLGLSNWAALLAASIQALHPIAAATVPSLPRRQDVVVGAMLLISMSLLARAALDEARPRWGFLVASLLAFFLALGGKEIAYAGIAVVPFVIACRWHPGRPLRPAVLAVLAFAMLEVVAFAIRWYVLGGLGGYYGSESVRGRLDGLIEFYLRPYVTDVLWPLRALMPQRLRDWLLVLGAIVAFVALCAAVMRRRFVLVVLLGLVWQACFLGLYVVVHTSLSAYLLYVPLAGLALMLGALIEGGVDAFRNSQRAVQRAAGLVMSVGVAALLLGVVRESAILTPYPEWADAGFVSDRFLEQALPCFNAADGGSVVVSDLPHRIDYPTERSQFVDAFVFEPYSLESAVRVLSPSTSVSFEVLSTIDVKARPDDVQVTCTPASGRWLLTSRVT